MEKEILKEKVIGVGEIEILKYSPKDIESRIIFHLVHGAMEYIERYEDFIKLLVSNGIVVYATDLPSHGRNFSKEKGFHDFRRSDAINTLLVVKRVIDKENTDDKKVVLFGHSFGSFLSREIIYSDLAVYDALILSGTSWLFDTLLNTAERFTRFSKPEKVSKFNNNLVFGSNSNASKFRGNGKEWLSSNPVEVEKYKNDPLCGNLFSNRSLNAMLSILKDNKDVEKIKNFKYKEMPQLIIFGAKDPVGNFGIDVSKYGNILKDNGINNITLIEYKNSKHEILFDVEKEKVMVDILNFLNKINGEEITILDKQTSDVDLEDKE